MARILIVDDDVAFCESLAETIADLGHVSAAVHEARAAEAAAEAGDWRLILLDLRLGEDNGLELLRRWRQHAELRTVPIVIVTAYADAANTIEAMKLGAFDHLTKPIGRRQVAEVIAQALSRPDRRSESTRPTVIAKLELLGNSPIMRELEKQIGLAAASEATVLITGETGTGKELIVRALHHHGSRKGKPLVAVNCAAMPAELLESELFGHTKGAFTGAASARLGRFREAEGGTLFLDEVGDMSLPMQAKLLRVIQERVVTPVGASASQPVDVRLVAATHHDLPQRVREEKFRNDLFYRLNVIPIHAPPLRERGEDILLLAEHFLARAAGSRQPKHLTPSAAQALREYPWPGNVRELENIMLRASANVRGAVIDRADLPPLSLPASDTLPPDWTALDLPSAIARLEKQMIVHALRESAGNRTEAARRLNIRRQLLYDKITQLQIEG
jgi:two-component system NtrC family response regulator